MKLTILLLSTMISVSLGAQSNDNAAPFPLAKSSKVTPPSITYSEEPKDTSEVCANHFRRAVTVNLIVDTDGNPINVHVIRPGQPSLDEAAVTAVQHFHFKPAMQNGSPIRVQMNVAVDFDSALQC